MIWLWLLLGPILVLGHLVCVVLASGSRARTADEISDAEYRRKAEARVRALCVASEGEIRVYRRAVTAQRSRVEREAEAIAKEAWG